jgi:hypothetical protein
LVSRGDLTRDYKDAIVYRKDWTEDHKGFKVHTGDLVNILTFFKGLKAGESGVDFSPAGRED